MAQRFSELTTYLVEDALGSLAATIFHIFATRGRLTLPQLQKTTHLSGVEIRRSIITLLQHHLLHQTSSEPELIQNADGEHEYATKTYYQVNWSGAYNTLRVGHFVDLIEERLGKQAAEIVEALVLQGHARVQDLVDQCKPSPSTSKQETGKQKDRDHASRKKDAAISRERETNGANGVVDAEGISDESQSAKSGQRSTGTQAGSKRQGLNMTEERFHQTTRQLLKSGFLSRINVRMYKAPADLYFEIEGKVIEERFPDGKITGQKKKLEFDSAVNTLKRKIREEDDFSDVRDLETKVGSKRSGSAMYAGPAKLQKVNGMTPNGSGPRAGHAEATDSGPRLASNMVIGVNHYKIPVALRSQRLERLATRYLGESCGAVYGALLRSLESKVRGVRDGISDSKAGKDGDDSDDDEEEYDLPSSSLVEVVDHLGTDIDLMCSITGLSDGSQNGINGKRKHQVLEDEDDFSNIGIKKVKKENASDDEAEEVPKDGQPPNGFHSYRDRSRRMKVVERHLALLAEHSLKFCDHVGNLGAGQWRVHFPALTQELVNHEVDTVIQSRYGRVGMRVVRMLRETGKLEEKEVALFTMMRGKTVRAVLNDLTSAGFLDFQEVPKDNYRLPNKTIYLYFIDQKRLEQKILYEAYLQIARCLQRLKIERTTKFKDVIEKSERILHDYGKQQHESMMTRNEKQLLEFWREIEERMWVTIERCDSVIAVLRDFAGKDTTMLV
ncbi:hypothetical protein K431DRAFT_289425 [Polychaeton citri CBS 116435]|uniref:DNA-directed RNA polymerase III subunit RPC3 n=1 Tax=Polychaeton citri CBS 116435 TaxID=1314669 RepID=A0A9P4PZ29_9PEZI|nr:hypothetical protein K431DRAFT_289425 [Polychaeton citri CBS 116435]